MFLVQRQETKERESDNVRRYYEINTVIEKLDTVLCSHRYGDGRTGIIPPEGIASAIADVRDAAATLLALSK